MNETPKEQDWRPSRGRFFFWLLALPPIMLGIAALATVLLTGREWTLPHWVAERIEEQLNARIAAGGARLDDVIFEVDTEGVPRVTLRNVALRDGSGTDLAQLNEVGARLLPGALLRGEVLPRALDVSGAQLTVRRAYDGAFSVSLGNQSAPAQGDLSGVLDAIDQAFTQAPLSSIERIDVDDLTISVEDARSGRVWQVTDGSMRLINDSDTIGITVVSEVFNGTEDLAGVQLSFLSLKGDTGASLGVRIDNAPAQDIALQAPVLSYLGVLDAPVSGALRTVIGSDGQLESVAATLELGAGALSPTPNTPPVPFNSGRAYFDYDAAQQRIEFSEVRVESDVLQLVGDGYAYLDDFRDEWPQTLIGQVEFTEIALSPEGFFENPLDFEAGMADLRMRLDPFSVEFGQVSLLTGNERIRAAGDVAAGEAGWNDALEVNEPSLPTDRLLALWPLPAVPGTRRWLEQHVRNGQLTDIDAAVRFVPGEEPRIGITYDFAGGDVTFLPDMPPITDGSGTAALIEGRYAMRLAEGGVVAPSGQQVDLTGTTLRIPDVAADVARAEIDLRVAGGIGDVLQVLDRKPLEILKKSGRPPDIAEGAVVASARIGVDLLRNVLIDDVSYEAAGTLLNVISTEIAPGRVLASDELGLSVTEDRIALTGPVTLDGVPIDAQWTQALEGNDAGQSRVDANIELSQRFLDTFAIDLPDDIVAGEGSGQVTLDLSDDAPPVFRLTSDLSGLAVSLPSLGWQKSAEESGELTLSGSLGDVPEIDQFSIQANGFLAEGDVLLDDEGGFAGAQFSRVAAGNWLDAPIIIRPAEDGGPSAIEIVGGQIDLRNAPPRDPADAASAPVPVAMTLERLVLSDTIVLAPFSGTMSAGGGMSGSFTANVNGGAPLSGTLVRRNDGTVIRATGTDAGQILRDARIFRSLDGGSFDLVLEPMANGEGFNGQLLINSTVLTDQSAIAELLDAVSIVGIIDELQGSGILFDTVDARFRLTPDRLILDELAAIGASLGMSLEGIYDIGAGQLDMQGVISPIYILNAVGQVFTRRGEGLFGFTFRMTGQASNPTLSVNPLSIMAPGFVREIFRGRSPGQPARQQQLPEEEREQP